MNEPVGWVRAVVIDAVDPAGLAAFWQAVLGVGIVEEQSDWIQLAPDRGRAYLAFQPVGAPASAGTTRLRIDLEVDDMDEARARLVALGARFVSEVPELTGGSHYRMADPEGNEFTVVLPLPPELAAAAYDDG
jgi:predicted enzyme related to lactoylglutathione lyase